jgi:hypothetical protein
MVRFQRHSRAEGVASAGAERGKGRKQQQQVSRSVFRAPAVTGKISIFKDGLPGASWTRTGPSGNGPREGYRGMNM